MILYAAEIAASALLLPYGLFHKDGTGSRRAVGHDDLNVIWF